MKKITICSSVSFYQQVIEYKKQLERADFKVLVPSLALEMEKANDFEFSTFAEKYDAHNPDRKAELMREHFERIAAGDAILVVNKTKHNVDGYIGANVLIEMGIAFYLKKPIFVTDPVPTNSNNYDEVSSMKTINIESQIQNIHTFFAK